MAFKRCWGDTATIQRLALTDQIGGQFAPGGPVLLNEAIEGSLLRLSNRQQRSLIVNKRLVSLGPCDDKLEIFKS
jgi:hypothetical protein